MLSTPKQFREYQVNLDTLADSLTLGWRVFDRQTRHLTWRVFEWRGGPTRIQGWKLHISAAVIDAVALSEHVLPLLIKSKVTFKVPNNIEGVLIINGGEIGETQIGKIVTIYPENDDQAASLAEAIDSIWSPIRAPFVPSDLALHPGSAVHLRYGDFSGGQVLVDSAGYYQPAIYSPAGSLVNDDRSLVGLQPAWAPPPPVACTPSTLPDIMETMTIENDDYLPLALLHQSPKGNVILAVQLDSAQLVILKRVIPGVSGDFFGFDARDRLINEYSLLSHLSKYQLTPQIIGLSDSMPTIMALEYIEGHFLNQLPRDEQIRSLPLLAETIARLHALGFAHNDVKLTNAVKVENQIKLIDFEHAALLGSRRKYLGGTMGYIPPEGFTDNVTTAADVYALGISMTHVLMGFDPGNLPANRGRLVGWLHLVGSHTGATLLNELTAIDPIHRLSAEQAARKLSLVNDQLQMPFDLECMQEVEQIDKRWCLSAAWEAADATRRFARIAHRGQWWQNFHVQSDFQCEAINIGAAGIILGLISIDRALKTSFFKDDILAGASWLAARHPINTCPGLFTGDAGVALALVMVGKLFGHQEMIDAARFRLLACHTADAELDLFTGEAGVLLTACLLASLLDSDWPIEIAAPIADRLLASAREVDEVIVWHPKWDIEDTPTLYTGAAHGSAGIAMALALWGKFSQSKPSRDLAFETFHSLYEYAQKSGGTAFPRTLGSASDVVPVGNWCHGLAGYLWCMLYALGDEPTLKEEIDWAVDGFSMANPIGNPTYCHGLSGQLELWRMLMAIPRYQKIATYRAHMVASALRLQYVRMEGKRVWCSEEPDTITPDLWVGFLGPASALALYADDNKDSLISLSWLQSCCLSSLP